MKLRTWITPLCLAVPGLCTALSAEAGLISYSFAGTVSDDEAARGFNAFAGSFSFDTAATDSIADTSTGAYAHAGAPWGLQISFDGGALITVNSSFNILVSNNLPGGDRWGQLAQDGANSFSLSWLNSAGNLFSSDALPQTGGGLTASAFDFGTLRWESADGALQGALTSLQCITGCGGTTTPPPDSLPPNPSPVHEPASLALAGLGLLLLRRRANRRPNRWPNPRH